MEENNTKPSSAAPSPAISAAASQQQQQLLLQQQLFMMQQHHQNQQQQQRPRPMQQQSQLQQAMSRFPSNIDAHLRAPGLRSNFQFNQNQIQQQQQQQQLQQQQQQQQQQRSGAQTPPARNPEVEMALQDAFKVCNPDVKSPFSSIEDAVTRLLPYHVVSDYEAEEDDKILESDKTGQVPSRLQQWDHNILVKIAEFTSTFEKQVLAFNIMTRKRSLGEFRSEERLLLEQALIQEERRAAMEAKLELESREKAARMAAMTNPDLLGGPGPSRTAMRGHLHTDDDRHQPPAWTQNNNIVNSNNEGNEGEEEGEDFLNEGEDEEDDGEFDLNAR